MRTWTAILLLATIAAAATAGEVVGWRTDGTGMYPDSDPPIEWSTTQNVLWKLPLPGWGNAIPVISGDRMFFTSEPDTLICVSLSQRKILWQRANPAPAPLPATHKTNGYASPVPVTNGKVVAVVYGSGVAACYDVDGNSLWSVPIQKPTHKWGHSSSPALVGQTLVVPIRDVFGLDLATGETKWTVPSKPRWGTPVTAKIGDVEVVITPNGEVIDPANGRVLAKGLAKLDYAAPLVHKGVVYFIERGGKAIKLPTKISDDMTFETLWETQPLKDRYYASPVIHNGLIFACTRYSAYSVIDAATGEVKAVGATNAVGEVKATGAGKPVTHRKLDFPKSRPHNTVYPSFVLAGGRVYVSHDSGVTLVLEPTAAYKQIARNTLEPFRSTPVAAGDRIYIRTLKNLYCIGK